MLLRGEEWPASDAVLPVLTLIIWGICLGVGILGLLLRYPRPKIAFKVPQPVLQALQVELKAEPMPTERTEQPVDVTPLPAEEIAPAPLVVARPGCRSGSCRSLEPGPVFEADPSRPPTASGADAHVWRGRGPTTRTRVPASCAPGTPARRGADTVCSRREWSGYLSRSDSTLPLAGSERGGAPHGSREMAVSRRCLAHL